MLKKTRNKTAARCLHFALILGQDESQSEPSRPRRDESHSLGLLFCIALASEPSRPRRDESQSLGLLFCFALTSEPSRPRRDESQSKFGAAILHCSRAPSQPRRSESRPAASGPQDMLKGKIILNIVRDEFLSPRTRRDAINNKFATPKRVQGVHVDCISLVQL